MTRLKDAIRDAIGDTCSDIISDPEFDVGLERQLRLGWQDGCMEETDKKRGELLRVQIKEDDTEKLTPMEYLDFTGEFPKPEDVRIMEWEDLTAADARRLLAAGASKRQIFSLYGTAQPGKPHYDKLKALLDSDPEPKKQDPGIVWFMPRDNLPIISVTQSSSIRIGCSSVISAPVRYRKGCIARIGMSGKGGKLIVQPVEQDCLGAIRLREYKRALRATSTFAVKGLVDMGVQIPATFDTTWDAGLGAWVGVLAGDVK